MVKNLPAMWETGVRPLSWEDHVKKEMATHYSILAWRIPWTEEPGGLQSMALQRITLAQRHSREDKPHSTNLCVVLRKAQWNPRTLTWQLVQKHLSLRGETLISDHSHHARLALHWPGSGGRGQGREQRPGLGPEEEREVWKEAPVRLTTEALQRHIQLASGCYTGLNQKRQLICKRLRWPRQQAVSGAESVPWVGCVKGPENRGHLGPPSSTWKGPRDDSGFCFLSLSSVWCFPKCLLEIRQGYHLPAIVCLGQRHNFSEPQVLYPKSRPKILWSWLYEWGTPSKIEWKSMKWGKTAPGTW